MTYREALSWLYGTQRFGVKLGLTNAERLFAALPLPASETRTIHVAGTNGKGSVCAMAAAICRAQGLRTGLFTSPHLITFRERIQLDGEMISEPAVAAGLTTIRDLTREWEPHPTFFEITTALGLLHFAARKCEVVVLETGLGGRLDATNAITANVSVLTPIALDHQEWLGNSIAEIAAEKAGIIKPGVPVISAPQEQSAEEVIRARAAACGSALTFVTKRYTCSELSVAGEHQRWNASLAVAAVAAAGIAASEAAVKEGLATVDWPARFQRWSHRIIIDGGHNEAGAFALAQTWREVFGNQRAHIVFATLRDKGASAIWRLLAPIAARVSLPCFRSERALPTADLRGLVESISPEIPVREFPDVAAALAQTTDNPQELFLITGSVHFAGEALATLSGNAGDLEECSQ